MGLRAEVQHRRNSVLVTLIARFKTFLQLLHYYRINTALHCRQLFFVYISLSKSKTGFVIDIFSDIETDDHNLVVYSESM